MALVWQDNEEYVAIIADLLAKPEVQRLAAFVHHKVTNRLAHSIAVSYRSFLWAKRFNLDAVATARAGLLHDLFYYESYSKNEVGGKGHNYEHPRIALKNAMALTNLSDKEEDIILKHMCGATFDIPAYYESVIVTLMDKYTSICEWGMGIIRWSKGKLGFSYQVMKTNL